MVDTLENSIGNEYHRDMLKPRWRITGATYDTNGRIKSTISELVRPEDEIRPEDDKEERITSAEREATIKERIKELWNRFQSYLFRATMYLNQDRIYKDRVCDLSKDLFNKKGEMKKRYKRAINNIYEKERNKK